MTSWFKEPSRSEFETTNLAECLRCMGIYIGNNVCRVRSFRSDPVSASADFGTEMEWWKLTQLMENFWIPFIIAHCQFDIRNLCTWLQRRALNFINWHRELTELPVSFKSSLFNWTLYDKGPAQTASSNRVLSTTIETNAVRYFTFIMLKFNICSLLVRRHHAFCLL